MKEVMKDESGLSLAEVLAAIAIFSVVMALLGGIIQSISIASTAQKEKLEFQQKVNTIATQLKSISQIDKLYTKAGYLGKFKISDDGTNWDSQKIIKVTDVSDGSIMETENAGSNEISITDILDDTGSRAKNYKMINPDYKIKILQSKNKNELTSTQYGTPNYRDTFTIQTSVLIIIYKGDITFTANSGSTEASIEAIKKMPEVKYCREVELTYRDEQKAKGEVPGDGQW